jgi:uncharacterized protein
MNKFPSNVKRLSLPFQVKALDDEQGIIEAYGSVFNNEDMGGDVVRPGAFKRTIQNNTARMQAGKSDKLAVMLWQHDPDQPIGKWTEMKEDAHGLLCKGKITLDTQLGRDAYALIKDGVINEFSIGYEVMPGGANYDSKTGVRNLTELRLWEVSPVTFAMNQEALLVGVKALEGKLMDKKEESPKQRKTLLEHYNEEMAEDLLEDWQDVYVCALTGAIFDAFVIGDQPQADISQALDDFKELVMSKFVTQAVECNLSQYLSDNDIGWNPAEYTIHNGSDDAPYYGYMSHRTPLSHKAGKPISAANQGNIDDHVAGLHDTADKGMKALKQVMQHMKAIHAQADNFATTMSGDKPDDEDDKKPDGEGKSLEDALTLVKGLRTNR